MTDIRQLTEDQFDQMVDIAADAYPGVGLVTAEDRADAVKRVKKRLSDKRISHWGAFRGDEMVGVMRMHDFTMNILSVKMQVGGLGGVAVHLAHKKEHVAKKLVEFYLDHYDKKGTPMATLWPFRADFYRNMGFGLGGRIYQYRIRPDSFPRGFSKEHVRYLTVDDVKAINECFNRFVETRTGMVYEVEPYWQSVFEFGKGVHFVGCEIDGRLEGFFNFRFEPEKPGHWLLNNMVVTRLVYNTPQALQEMLAFLRSQFDQINRVVLHTPEDEFFFLLSDPYNDLQQAPMPPVNQASHTAAVGIMFRVMDSRRLFNELSDHDFGGVTAKLNFVVKDSFFSKNDGSFILEVKNGRAAIVDDGDFEAEVTLDVADYSSLVTGAVRFCDLHTYGLAKISDARFIETVDRMFYQKTTPVCMAEF
ncbi:MAG: GNAT family N-acetyltransferase [Candidatus Zixiibacteriota bacterium]|nr:MAG: GNAT family N-acetyltransferase [candidate division Zixibacteria bacterium]